MKTIRVFPRKTIQTPTDELSWIGYPDLFSEADQVLVSCTFSWDKPEAERMAEAWNRIAPTTLGGPAFDDPGGEFEPGKFLKTGYTITSRGCNNRCWFCYAWKRSGNIRELEIKDGWFVQDDNLLACSETHVRSVFAMLKRQPERAKFTGGIEAALIKDWHVELIADLKPTCIFFAYDTEDDYEPLVNAVKLFNKSNYHDSRQLMCYVLIGYPEDTFDLAEARLKSVYSLGVMPYAMLWRNDKGLQPLSWKQFQRFWVRPRIIRERMKNINTA